MYCILAVECVNAAQSRRMQEPKIIHQLCGTVLHECRVRALALDLFLVLSRSFPIFLISFPYHFLKILALSQNIRDAPAFAFPYSHPAVGYFCSKFVRSALSLSKSWSDNVSSESAHPSMMSKKTSSVHYFGPKMAPQAQPSPCLTPKTTNSALGLLSKLAQRGLFALPGPLHTWPAPRLWAPQPKP